MAVLMLVSAAFLLFDFRLMKSNTNTQSTVASSRAGDITPQAIQPETTGVSVVGWEGMVTDMREQLVKALQNQQNIGSITAINTPVDKLDIPQMRVLLEANTHFWTPLYARADYKVIVSYASNGDISFSNQEVAHFRFTSSEPAMQFQETLTFTDTSVGLISAPAYKRYLAEMIASNIQKTLQQEYNR